MKELIAKAKANGGAATCDPRAFYPVGHKCGGSTRPVVWPGLIDPNKAVIKDTQRIAPDKVVSTIETTNDNVTAVTDNGGRVESVEVAPKGLTPLQMGMLAVGAFLLFGG